MNSKQFRDREVQTRICLSLKLPVWLLEHKNRAMNWKHPGRRGKKKWREIAASFNTCFSRSQKKRIDQHQNQWRWDPINQDKNTRSTLIPIFYFFFQTTLHQLHSLLLFLLLLLLLLLIAIPNNTLTYFSSKPSTSFSSSSFTKILFTSFPRSTCWPFLSFFFQHVESFLPTRIFQHFFFSSLKSKLLTSILTKFM